MTFKTPGVYIEEITTFPPSVVAVETAIPAFIGYTERAAGADGGSLLFVPTRIRSLLEFEERFGGAFRPASYRVRVNTAAGNAIGAATPRDAANNERHYYLYGCLRHFYANGGGPCYIVSVGSFADAPILGVAATPSGLAGGLARVEVLDEPTLLVFPDGVSLTAAELGSLQVAALAQCAKLQDRFMVTDLRDGALAATIGNDPVVIFRQQVGTNNLKYGAAYYPWVQTVYRPGVRFFQLRLVDPGDVAIPNGTLDALTGDAALDSLVPAARGADANAATVLGAVATPMTGVVALDRDNFTDLPGHFARLQKALRDLPTDALVGPIRAAFGNIALLPRTLARALQTLDADPSLSATLASQIDGLRADTGLVNAIIELIALEKNDDVRNCVATTRTVANVETDYASLNGTGWISPNANAAAIAPNGTDFGDTTPAALRQTALSAASALQGPFDRLAAAVRAVYETAEILTGQAEKRLFERHPVYGGVLERIQSMMSLLPVSGGVAGVYAATDRARGVWKAPANISLADVVAPAVKLNDLDQADLNVHSTGKSVNAIRAFTGKGTLVWGARTLAGNDNEWRYVAVRRFFNMAEESIKEATEPFVFEPNDAGTWVRVRAMIENFLTVQWRQGALAGATPVQAFFVRVGLGETMTAQDILEGRMIVEVGMAVVRPAEFIVLRFAHKMQVS
jgi:Bacteriophage tail sheath protein